MRGMGTAPFPCVQDWGGVEECSGPAFDPCWSEEYWEMEFQCRSGRLGAVKTQGKHIYTVSIVLFGLIRGQKQKPERKIQCVLRDDAFRQLHNFFFFCGLKVSKLKLIKYRDRSMTYLANSNSKSVSFTHCIYSACLKIKTQMKTVVWEAVTQLELT